MNDNAAIIELAPLALMLVPVVIVIFIMAAWRSKPLSAFYATFRMVAQLLLVGYALVFVFTSARWWLVAAIVVLMVVVSSWIALRPLERRNGRLYRDSLLAIGLSGLLILGLVLLVVVPGDPWFEARVVIPLAGMVFANSMNVVSLAAERFQAEVARGQSLVPARNKAFSASLIPLINSYLAVGLVSLPGMMTGQILSGTSPLVAVRYQIMVMCMLLGAGGIAAALFLQLQLRQRHPPG